MCVDSGLGCGVVQEDTKLDYLRLRSFLEELLMQWTGVGKATEPGGECKAGLSGEPGGECRAQVAEGPSYTSEEREGSELRVSSQALTSDLRQEVSVGVGNSRWPSFDVDSLPQEMSCTSQQGC